MNQATVKSSAFADMLSSWAILTLAIIVMFLLTVSGLIIDKNEDSNRDIEADLINLQSKINRLNSLEWQVMAERRVDIDTASEVSSLCKDIRLLLIVDRNNEDMDTVIKKYNIYENYLIQEFDLLDKNEFVLAKLLDQQHVDSSFKALEQEISKVADIRKRMAKKTNLFGYAGLGLMFLFAAGTALLLFLQFKHQRLINKQIEMDKNLKKEMARLERLNLIGEMAASIGHEIRNPMTTVRGFLQIMSGKQELTPLKKEISLMIEELDRANSIIKEYLNLANNKSIHLKRTNINSVVTSMYPLIKADAMLLDKNVTLELGEIPDINLDEKEIRQLLLNLSRNGLEAMTCGRNLKIKTWTGKNNVVLTVEDQGSGIDGKHLDKLGTPFFTTKDDGTGLGLAVCYSIAVRHNASIRVDTGKSGTAFHVEFSMCGTEVKKVANM